MPNDDRNRCRLVLVTPRFGSPEEAGRSVSDALSGGDVATVIAGRHGLDDNAYGDHVRAIANTAHERDVAVLAVNDTRITGRAGADGVHCEMAQSEFAAIVRSHEGRMIIGAGGATTRHAALDQGEMRPDYVMFGKIGGDIRPEAHPKLLELATWWAELVEIPCIVLGGTDVGSVVEVAASGAEFVALSAAVFGQADPARVVAQANSLLDERAPGLKERAEEA